MTDRTVPTGPMPGNCTRCGFPWKEHTYNGACYGICGQFVAASPPAPGAEVEPVAWGEFYGGRCAAVRLDRSVHCQTPLYLSPPTTDAIRAQARREALEEAAAWHDDQAALHDAQGEACGMGSDGWKRHTVAAADHRRSATSIRAPAGKGEAE